MCEDIWEPGPPASDEALAGATLIVNISASPYHAGKGLERERMFAQRARDNLACVAFCGLVGGQDELVFDGHSFVIDHTGETIARAAQFREELLVCDVDLDGRGGRALREAGHRPGSRAAGAARSTILPALPGADSPLRAGADRRPRRRRATPIEPVEAEIYAALTLGLHDYVEKNGFAPRRARPVRRHRLRAGRLPGRRRARRRAGERRDHALALLLRGHPGGRARARGGARGRARTSCRSSRSMDAYERDAAGRVRRAARTT